VDVTNGALYDISASDTTTNLVSSATGALVNNVGSLAAQIMCDGAVPGTSTCPSSNELPGIAFDAPRAGAAYICVRGIIYASENSGVTDFEQRFVLQKVATDGSVASGLQGTTYTSLEDIQLVLFRMEMRDTTFTNPMHDERPYYLCGITNLTAGKNGFVVGERTIKNSGTPTTLEFTAVRWNVFPIEQQLPQALITQGKVYYTNSNSTITGLADNTWTDLGLSLYLPAGKYEITINGLVRATFSVVPNYGQAALLLSDTPSTHSTVLAGGNAIGMARGLSTLLDNTITYSREIDWAGGNVYLYGYARITGGTVTDRSVAYPSIKATRLD